MADSISKSGLQSLLSGELIPLIPDAELLKDTRELYHYLQHLQEYIRRLLAFITLENISNEPPPPPPPGAGQTIPVAWRYDAAANKFQRKTRNVQFLAVSAESAWEDIPDGNQPEQITRIVRDVNYNAGTSALTEDIVETVNVLQKAADTNDVPVGTISTAPPPTVTMTVVTGWHYDTGTHKWQVKTMDLDVIAASAESDWINTPDGQPVVATRFVTNVDYNTSTHILSEDHRADVYVLEMGDETTGTNVNTAVIGDCS